MKRRFWITLGTNLICLLTILLIMGNLALSTATTDKPTTTEAPGGVFGSVVGLLCPVNLTGVGPTWKTITVGQSTLQDLQDLYAPYGKIGEVATPYPLPTNYPQGIYAENYDIHINWRQFRPEFGLPGGLSVCVVDGKIAALMLYPDEDPELPQNIVDLVGLLGSPIRHSFHDAGSTYRMVHWPMDGVSAQIEHGGTGVDVIFYYPFRGADYEKYWPMNALITVAPTPFSTLHPTLELDTIDDEWVAQNLTAYPRPTRTPPITPTPKS